ncbi:MAG: DUF4011 domain-containing protein [Planctomycetota bacterium]|nr:MAG: DUF4011 domain-containing protein [Planctomycetota bacterium]
MGGRAVLQTHGFVAGDGHVRPHADSACSSWSTIAGEGFVSVREDREQRAEDRSAARGLSLEVQVAPKINYACFQNDVPVLREMSVRNDGGETLEDLRLEMTADPEFVVPRQWHISRLESGRRVHVQDLQVSVAGGLLWDLTEAVRSAVRFRLSAGDRELLCVEQSVDLLAKNEWGGLASMPEMIAAFVMPNDPAVDVVLGRAAEILRASGGDTSLNGYDTGDPQRVVEQVAAVWTALSGHRLSYVMPPASFEVEGQKVRSPSRVLQAGVGTCLDLSVLLAACLEQCRLHPLLVFYEGHAFVGCWTVPEQFSSVLVDDVTALRKRMNLGQMVFFESTLLTGTPAAPFRAAYQSGKGQLDPRNDERFLVAVDVCRARLERIRPLAEAETSADDEEIPRLDLPPERLVPEQVPRLDGPDVDIVPSGRREAEERDRLDHWKNRLLDLSLRNRLLNFRETRRTIRVRCSQPAVVEDCLADGKKLRLVSSSEVACGVQERSEELHQRRTGEDLWLIREQEALARNELLVDLPRDELEQRLVELYRAARTALQEGGTNTLYLAMGFLAWARPDDPDRRLLAPLVLVPVRLQRQSVRRGFVLEAYDEEPRVNPTLLEMLKQDFGLDLRSLADAPPTDEHGLDVERIQQAFTVAVRDQPGWEVVPDVVLATFSFAKYLMWADLQERGEQLKQNELVRHLIESPSKPYRSGETFPDPRELDRRYGPERTFTILSADSSQLSAVLAAAEGQDFVLFGPPGTGKSQTIANMIAQCLAQGRRVLFVAEKTAALEVVARRLEQAGLGEFCLELHSHKAQKAAVLERLRKAWETVEATPPEDRQRRASELKKLRGELNRFVERLHRVYPNGLSVFDAIGRAADSEATPQIAFAWSDDAEHTVERLQRWQDLSRRIAPVLEDIPAEAASALAGVRTSEWSPRWQTDFLSGAAALREAAATFRQALDRFAEACGLGDCARDVQGVRAMAQLARTLGELPDIDASFLLGPGAAECAQRLQRAGRLVAARTETIRALSRPYRLQEVLGADVARLRRSWESSRTANVLLRWYSRWWVRRGLKKLTIDGVTPDCERDLPLLEKLQELEREGASYEDLREQAGAVWRGWDSDVSTASAAPHWCAALQAAASRLGGSVGRQREVLEELRGLLSLGHAGFGPGTAVGDAARQVCEQADRFESLLAAQAALAGNTVEGLFDRDAGDWLSSVVERGCAAWAANGAHLRAWCLWRRLVDELVEEGLQPLADAVQSGRIAAERAPEVLEVNYCRWWSGVAIERDPVLRTFSSREREHLIGQFRELDDRWQELTRQYVRAKLAATRPRSEGAPRGRGWSVLSREIRKQRRHKPIRQLFTEAADAVLTLTPCVMMSPLSVAQYLAPEQQLFDVVIFDEASQIPPWDAIGSLARARRAVIVGDPRQLPPTSFFTRSLENDEEAVVEEDLESILDECLAANVPTLELRWHYRSRHESLIAFSNHHYYDGKLVTFPSAVTEDRAVRRIPVPEGVYERGGSRTNLAEARAVVDHIAQRLLDPAFRDSGQSIGVVTFNMQQQTLIEDLLDEARAAYPEIERWFSDDVDEPVFVKNLESVQGDERDIIYFSVTYGPDADGRISMNFGPLNNQGGHRRLNVAITRARRELLVFSTLESEQIDLRRTQAAGVRDFKQFLQYAEQGAETWATLTTNRPDRRKNAFGTAVAQALRAKGWEVRERVGTSAFLVDLAVVHPDDRSRFLAGIEYDGPTYRDSATARDRDKLRHDVLGGLGWRLLRVWAIDWWANPQTTAERLDRELRRLLEESSATA